MKLVLYNVSNEIIEVFENIRAPVVDVNNVEWEGGSLTGINLPFCLLDDQIDIQEVMTEDIKLLCLKDKYLKVDLKSRLEATEREVEELKTLVGTP